MKSTKALLAMVSALQPVVASEECGLSNLGTCLVQRAYDFIIQLLNAPLHLLIDLIKKLLGVSIDISPVKPLWEIIILVISMFYGILFLIVGLKFLVSGYSAEKRALAKESLKNLLLLIIILQMSYYLYGLLIEISAELSVSLLNLIDPSFFTIYADSFTTIGIEFIFLMLYLAALLLSILLLSMRYLMVIFGALLFPIAILLMFSPYTKVLGRSILHFILVFIFLPIPFSIALLVTSYFVGVAPFEGNSILVTISGFLLALLFSWYVLKLGGYSVGKTTKKVVTQGVVITEKVSSVMSKL